jgi:hypothetical protein
MTQSLPRLIKDAREPGTILRAVGRKASARKVALFSIACCRRVSSRIANGKLITVLEALEDVIDGRAPKHNIATMRQDAQADLKWAQEKRGLSEAELFERYLISACLGEIGKLRGALSLANWCVQIANLCPSDGPPEQEEQAHLARDVFSAVWCASPIPSNAVAARMAEAAYVTSDFQNLPILADALEEAGCNRAEVLDHCRTPGTHVRGCWVVDLVLGKDA